MNNVIATIKQVSKNFSETRALHEINLDIVAGKVTSILGPNGAGKTTLINILLGRLNVSSGEVLIFSNKPGLMAIKRLCGAMLQVPSLPDTLTVKEHLELFQCYYSNPMDYQYLIDLIGLNDIEHRLTKNLSGGQKQKLLFALAICGNPKLLFLDEPSVGLDVSARKVLWNIINELKGQGTAIVLTTHYLEEADQLSDEIVMLKKGQIIKRGTPEEIKESVKFKKINFRSSVSISTLLGIDGINEVDIADGYVELKTVDSVAALKKLFNLVDDITDLTITAAALEDAFIHLNEEKNDIAA